MTPRWVKGIVASCSKKDSSTTNDLRNARPTYTIRGRDMLDTDSSSSEGSDTAFLAPSEMDEVEERLRHHGLYCRTKKAVKKFLHIKGKKGKGGSNADSEHSASRIPDDAPRLLPIPPDAALDFEDTVLDDTEIESAVPPAPSPTKSEDSNIDPSRIESPEQAGQGHSRQGSSVTYVEDHYKQTGSSIADDSDNGLNYMQTGSSIANVSDEEFQYKETGSSIANVSDEDNGPTVDTVFANIPRMPGCIDLTSMIRPDETEEDGEDKESSLKSKKTTCADDEIYHPHHDDSDDDEDSPDWHGWMYHSGQQPSGVEHS